MLNRIPDDSPSFPCSAKSMSVPGSLGLWPPWHI